MIYELYKANLIAKYAYSFYISQGLYSSNDHDSMFFLGGSNSSYYDGPLHFVHTSHFGLTDFNITR